MGKKKGGRRPDAIRKIAKGAFRILRVTVAVLGFGHGAVSALAKDLPSANFQAIPRDMIYAYTGYDPQAGAFNPNQTMVSAGTLAATFVVVKILGWAAKAV